MQPQFNPINQLIRIDGATVKVNDPTGKLYATVTVNPDYTVTAAKVGTRVMPKLDEIVANGVSGLYRFVSRRHADDPGVSPETLVQEFYAGMRQSRNRQNFPKRGDKTR